MSSVHHQGHHLSMQLIVINRVWPHSIEFQKMILILCSLCLYVETKTRYCELTTSTPESEGAYTIRHMLLSDYKDAGGTSSQYQKCKVVKVRLGSSH